MSNLVKKITIFSLVGMMQIGISASVIEASPLHNEGSQRIVQLDDRDHDDRQRQENERHEREMRRHDHESDRDWHDRQEREKQRHDNTMNEIAAGLVGILIGSQIK
ncbi:MAG TPA: hypothetical protein VGL27_00360 [Negativicutes bacterium]